MDNSRRVNHAEYMQQSVEIETTAEKNWFITSINMQSQKTETNTK